MDRLDGSSGAAPVLVAIAVLVVFADEVAAGSWAGNFVEVDPGSVVVAAVEAG